MFKCHICVCVSLGGQLLLRGRQLLNTYLSTYLLTCLITYLLTNLFTYSFTDLHAHMTHNITCANAHMEVHRRTQTHFPTESAQLVFRFTPRNSFSNSDSRQRYTAATHTNASITLIMFIAVGFVSGIIPGIVGWIISGIPQWTFIFARSGV